MEEPMEMTTTNTKSLEKREDRQPQPRTAPMLPPVDIVEDRDGITLRADMPGVSRDNLSISVDGDNLTIEGAVSLGEPSRMDDMYVEVRLAQYKRSFALGRDLDTGKIEAHLANGVLTLAIPKLEQAKPRRIEVKAQ
jgi:HSP20 family protein